MAAEADPTVVGHLFERFQNLNVFPRRVVADWGTNGQFHVHVYIAGVSEERLTLIRCRQSSMRTSTAERVLNLRGVDRAPSSSWDPHGSDFEGQLASEFCGLTRFEHS